MNTLLITPVKNVEDDEVVDAKKVKQIQMENNDPILVKRKGKYKAIRVVDVSLYDDMLIIDGKEYKLLQMLSVSNNNDSLPTIAEQRNEERARLARLRSYSLQELEDAIHDVETQPC